MPPAGDTPSPGAAGSFVATVDNNGTVSAAARSARIFTFRRVVSSVLLAIACGGIVAAFIMHDETPPEGARPTAVGTVSPEPGSLQLRQTEIFVELDPRYSGTLSVNGTVIPDDQVDLIEGLNRYSFTPGEDKEIDELPPGRTCALITFDQTVNPGTDPGRFRWCFNVS
jgi:hypothetical protein